MAKIDPVLRLLAGEPTTDEPDLLAIVSRRRSVRAGRDPNVMIELEDDVEPPELAKIGFARSTRAGRVLTGSIPRKSIQELERVPGVKRAEAARVLSEELDVAVPHANVVVVHNPPMSLRGAGVLVAVIDSGIDYQHLSFRARGERGTTRIHSLWDQGRAAGPGQNAPASFRYGVEYTAAQINDALAAAEPSTLVPHRDLSPFHGTHVAGIAAGNGQPIDESTGRELVGVAPEADLVVVANTRAATLDPGTLGDSADTLDAVAYILSVAKKAGKAVAINLSQGDNIGPHDGTSLLELGIASLIGAVPGRVLVKSAGNEARARHHAEGTLDPATDTVIPLIVPEEASGTASEHTEVVVDIWAASLRAIVIEMPPPHSRVIEAVVGFTGAMALPNGNRAFIAIDSHDPGNGLARAYVALEAAQTAIATGLWTIRLRGCGPWHAWIQRDCDATFSESLATGATTISIPGTSRAVISVGSYMTKALGDQGALSAWSSRGPTRDGRRAPTLAAPGEEIRAAQPGTFGQSGRVDHFLALPGTSMAAAMVTGAAALMLSVNPTLTAEEIRECLERSAAAGPHTGNLPNDAFGAGRLDVGKAIDEVKRLSATRQLSGRQVASSTAPVTAPPAAVRT